MATELSWRRLRKIVRTRDRGTCVYCGVKASDGDVDHVLPLSLGGRDSIDNLVWSCRDCNRNKQGKTLRDWVKSILENKAYPESNGSHIHDDSLESSPETLCDKIESVNIDANENGKEEVGDVLDSHADCAGVDKVGEVGGQMEQLTVSVRELRRDKAGEVETAISSGEVVRVEDYGFIVSASNPAVSWLETPEPAHSCYSLYTRGDGDDRVVVPARMSQNHPIPIRFGTSAEVKAWMVPLSWGPRLEL